MKKQDILILGLLLTLVVFLQPLDRLLFKTFDPEGYEQAEERKEQLAEQRELAALRDTEAAAAGGVSTNTTRTVTTPPEIGAPEPVDITPPVPPVETNSVSTAQTLVLSNAVLRLEVSSAGAGVVGARLLEFPEERGGDIPVAYDFSSRPAMVYREWSGLDGAIFRVEEITPGRIVEFQAVDSQGIILTRRMTLGDDYRLEVRDTIQHTGEDVHTLPQHELQLATIPKLDAFVVGPAVGIDALLQESGDVKHFEGKLKDKANDEPGTVISHWEERPLDWVAVKNKFFAQLVTFDPTNLPAPVALEINGLYQKEGKQLVSAASAVRFQAEVLDPKSSLTRTMTFFMGPKRLEDLKPMGEEKTGIMQFYGFMAPKAIVTPISKLLLTLLNIFESWIHSYGFSIILLTVVVRTVFWPLTHKSAQSMKKMQKLAPQMQAIKEKHKDPQKQQQEIMNLYKTHKVNPLSGCLPILIQFPVFIALFFVIRSAVELRFESFFWIRDLSEPENLLADVLPFGLNLLPVAMAGTMFLQQRLMPTATDPAQQKIMKLLPVMMLVFMYSMPSGLMLYWTTSNGLAILQQLHTRRQAQEEVEEEKAAQPEPSPLSKPPVKQKAKKKR